MSVPSISRRDFLQKFGVGGAAAAAAWVLDAQVAPVYASAGVAEWTWGILIDMTRCTGCNSCALACKESNGLLHPDITPDALGPEAYSFVEERAVVTAGGAVQTRFVKRQCMHCLDAACVAACPAAAMYKSAEGPVIYRAYRCLGCRYCEVACPFEVPRFNWDDSIDPVINKCWLCYERLKADEKPACVEACPDGALRFGRREELLAQAHAQIASNPGRYVDHVFGEFEVGGTSMLYLSDVPFAQLGFAENLPKTAPPKETEKIVAKLPFVLTGVAALMSAAVAYTHRKPSESLGEGEEATTPPILPSDRQEE